MIIAAEGCVRALLFMEAFHPQTVRVVSLTFDDDAKRR
jgi:hypothetical protein